MFVNCLFHRASVPSEQPVSTTKPTVAAIAEAGEAIDHRHTSILVSEQWPGGQKKVTLTSRTPSHKPPVWGFLSTCTPR